MSSHWTLAKLGSLVSFSSWMVPWMKRKTAAVRTSRPPIQWAVVVHIVTSIGINFYRFYSILNLAHDDDDDTLAKSQRKKIYKFKFHSIHIPPNLNFQQIPPPHHCVKLSYCAFNKTWEKKNKRLSLFKRERERLWWGIRTRGQTDGHWPTVWVSSLLLLPRGPPPPPTSLARLLWPNPNGKRKKRKTIVLSLSLVSEFVAYSIEVGATQWNFPPRFSSVSPNHLVIFRLAGLENNRIKKWKCQPN